MKKLITMLALSALTVASAQDDVATPSNWSYKANGSLGGTHASFKNWNAGGQNTISWIALFDAQANYKKKKFSWDNGLSLGYGQNRIVRNPWAKTDDVISMFSKAGYALTNKWNAALLLDFRSQFDLGYNADGAFTSKFMAPGYLTIALGAEYKPNDKFQMLVSPLAGKLTFVNDFTLSLSGAYGVVPGETLRTEMGAFVKFLYTDQVMENVTFKGKLELFSNYFNNPGNIDVNLETLFSFKINKWLAASWSMNLLYDDDIDISVYDQNNSLVGFGPRAQIKNVLSMGVAYTFAESK